jgi:hypothetical protein
MTTVAASNNDLDKIYSTLSRLFRGSRSNYYLFIVVLSHTLSLLLFLLYRIVETKDFRFSIIAFRKTINKYRQIKRSNKKIYIYFPKMKSFRCVLFGINFNGGFALFFRNVRVILVEQEDLYRRQQQAWHHVVLLQQKTEQATHTHKFLYQYIKSNVFIENYRRRTKEQDKRENTSISILSENIVEFDVVVVRVTSRGRGWCFVRIVVWICCVRLKVIK